jgi:hypothetical protein
MHFSVTSPCDYKEVIDMQSIFFDFAWKPAVDPARALAKKLNRQFIRLKSEDPTSGVPFMSTTKEVAPRMKMRVTCIGRT